MNRLSSVSFILFGIASIIVFVGGIFFLSGTASIYTSFAEAQKVEISTETQSALALAALSKPQKAYVPILAYHIVRPSYPSDDAAVRKLALTPETFDAELAQLQTSGYHVIGFRDLEAHFDSSTPLPTKPIILSFDDAWGDQYEYAFPILEKYHDTATFFVFTNAIGSSGFLTWSDLRSMIAAGMTIGDHSRSHPFLTRITATTTLWNEINESKVILEQKLGVPITEFAYPFGQYNATIISLVKQAGFKSARGDSWNGDEVDKSHLFTLPALNAPTTIEAFNRRFHL